MKTMRLLPGIAVLGLLAGCATGGEQYEKAKGMTAAGNDFTKALFAEYLDLSKRDLAGGDGRNSDANALKAAMAAQGAEVMPDEIASRNIPSNAVEELRTARGRLVGALAQGRQRAPAASAKAQVMFDCWLEQAENRDRSTDLKRCSDGFAQAIAQIPAAAPPAAAASGGAPQKFVVYFDYNSAALNTAANQVIASVVAAAQGATGIDVVGFTDTAGSPRYNFALSAKRADAVVQSLVKGGLPAPRISQASMGENNPAVNTADGVRETKNRRVEITVTK